jgi:16S rRNA (guanine(966)-N(2))-methyltransferase RsmD
LRIISGSHRGRQFNPPKGFRSRPTTDIARESLFNILSNTYQIEGLFVFDLFAGSGSISYEFASRGAEQVLCVEKIFPVFKHLIKTVNNFAFTQIKVIKKDAFIWLKKTEEKADIIFADPPFDNENISELPRIIFSRKILKSGGCFVLEHKAELSFEEFEEYSHSKKYGSVNFSFFFVD